MMSFPRTRDAWRRLKAAWSGYRTARAEFVSFKVNGKRVEMTDDDKAHMAEAFRHMDDAFAAIDRIGRPTP